MTPEQIDALADEQLAIQCRLHGVHDGFFDIWGTHHAASDDLKRALLKILLRVDSAEMEPPRVDDSETTLGLYDPCCIVSLGENLKVNLSVRLDQCDSLHWLLQLENGEQVHGRFEKPCNTESAWKSSVKTAHLTARGDPWRPCASADRRQHLCIEIASASSSPLPLGYHELLLTVIANSDHAEAATVCCPIAITPPRCFSFADKGKSQSSQSWGLSAQLYAIRSARNWGIGDFTDLRSLAEFAVQTGANAIGLNPLHAIQTLRPGLGSPYSPSSREFFNPLYLDLESIPDFASSERAQAMTRDPAFKLALAQARESEFVNYDLVARLKIPVLVAMFEHFKANCLDDAKTALDETRGADFRTFTRSRGEAVQNYAIFEALQAHLAGSRIDLFDQYDAGELSGWMVWPEQYRDPSNKAVAEFCKAHNVWIEFFQYLQWCTHLQLLESAQYAEGIGVDCGLYLDLALGNDGGGGEVWGSQADYAIGASLGAPPDDLSPGGQDWGIVALNPARLSANAYIPFVRVLRAQMRVAGVLRIDHVMGLMRQFWTVSTNVGKQGGYVSAPFDELLGLVALESVRNSCIVIGEDLGTVPPEIRDKLRGSGVLSYRVLYFEKHWDEDGRFKTPEEYPAQALAVASTHDLPTVLGFWQDIDIEARRMIGAGAGGFPDRATEERVSKERAADRMRLLQTLEPFGIGPNTSLNEPPPHLVDSVHRFLSKTPCQLTMVQLEDLLAVQEQANLPGTTIEHRNWCRKLPVPIELWSNIDAAIEIGEIMRMRCTSS